MTVPEKAQPLQVVTESPQTPELHVTPHSRVVSYTYTLMFTLPYQQTCPQTHNTTQPN